MITDFSRPELATIPSRIGVSMKVGWMVLLRMSQPILAQYSATDFDSIHTAALLAL